MKLRILLLRSRMLPRAYERQKSIYYVAVAAQKGCFGRPRFFGSAQHGRCCYRRCKALPRGPFCRRGPPAGAGAWPSLLPRLRAGLQSHRVARSLAKKGLHRLHTLWRHVGGWEPLQTLSDEERHNFFSKTSGSSCWKTVQSRLVESLTRERATSLAVSVGGKYLPPAVWLKKGFTQDQVDRCQDWDIRRQ